MNMLLSVRKMLRLESREVTSRLWITEVNILLLLEQEFAFLMLTVDVTFLLVSF